jgi:hypothetical protein
MGAEAFPAQQVHRLDGHHTVRTATVGHNFAVLGQLGEPLPEFREGHWQSAWNVTGLIFPPRADIENDDLALTDAAEQFVASNGFHSAALLEIGLCDLPDLGEPGLGQLSQCVEEQADLIVRQPVLDKEALLLGFDEPGGTQDPQVLGCVCYGYVCLFCKRPDGARSLTEQVEKFEPFGSCSWRIPNLPSFPSNSWVTSSLLG